MVRHVNLNLLKVVHEDCRIIKIRVGLVFMDFVDSLIHELTSTMNLINLYLRFAVYLPVITLRIDYVLYSKLILNDV